MKAVPSKTTMPILECILMDATTNQIKFTTNDMELGIETIVELTTPTLLIFETLIAIILNIISFYACVKIYSIKDKFSNIRWFFLI